MLPRILLVVTACLSCVALSGCSAVSEAAAPTAAAIAAVAGTTPTPTPRAGTTYRLKGGTTVVVDRDRPVPAVVKKDAARRVTPVANQDLNAVDGNHAVAADEVLSARATELADRLQRPVAIVFRGSSDDGPMWTSLGSGHSDLYGARSATGRKADAIRVAKKWTKWNGGVVIITNQ